LAKGGDFVPIFSSLSDVFLYFHPKASWLALRIQPERVLGKYIMAIVHGFQTWWLVFCAQLLVWGWSRAGGEEKGKRRGTKK
jgi:hypothetical protein